MVEFREFPKIPRLYREVVVSEKIDGTNACVVVTEDGAVAAQSRSRLITPVADNQGFAAWVLEHADELRKLGPGHHFGEWWGRGIQRTYSRPDRKFSLFNATRWVESRPACCDVVPILCSGAAESGFEIVRSALTRLRKEGSIAAPGFMRPEGVVAYHTASGTMFKALLESDQQPKGQ